MNFNLFSSISYRGNSWSTEVILFPIWCQQDVLMSKTWLSMLLKALINDAPWLQSAVPEIHNKITLEQVWLFVIFGDRNPESSLGQ